MTNELKELHKLMKALGNAKIVATRFAGRAVDDSIYAAMDELHKVIVRGELEELQKKVKSNG